MKTLKFNDREEWLFARRGKITGSTLKDVVSLGGPTKEMIAKELTAQKVEFKSTAKKEELEKLLSVEATATLRSQLPKKIGFYELIAARLGVPPDGENQMERGSRLEADAVDRFAKESGKEVDASLLIWQRDDNESIAISPDGVISETEAVEAKCLSSARHIEAFLTKQVPADYWMQVLQYFIVNDALETLHFVFYDPRFAMFSPSGDLQMSGEEGRKVSLDYFVIEVKREQVQAEVTEYLEYQRSVIAEVNAIVNKLTF